MAKAEAGAGAGAGTGTGTGTGTVTWAYSVSGPRAADWPLFRSDWDAIEFELRWVVLCFLAGGG